MSNFLLSEAAQRTCIIQDFGRGHGSRSLEPKRRRRLALLAGAALTVAAPALAQPSAGEPSSAGAGIVSAAD
ncbi:MAG TPA: hypothetical protein VFP12_04695, partial [Allosphingosinicella sp.]|nr:hypothetical protein [Allosphingosinicella sp.]